MDIISFFQDYGVSFHTEGYKYCRPGWVNVDCPYCTGNPGPHLGFELSSNHFNCWRCGWHPIVPTIAKLINIHEHEVENIIKQYGTIISYRKEPNVKVRIKAHRLPSNTTPLQTNHKQYLENRGFDAEQLERDWSLVGTGPISLLDNMNYRFRIIIPFIWNGQQVSFDSRDITGKTDVRYMACPKERELIPHKEILYGRQDKWTDVGICVEGPTDVWRLGFNSFAVSGIEYTPKQVRLMAGFFLRVIVCFDDDPQAIIQANKLVSELRFRGVDAKRVDIIGDPGSMKQEYANYFVKQLIK